MPAPRRVDRNQPAIEANKMYGFMLRGKVKPYVRMTQRSKHVDPQAKEYLASKEAIGFQLREQMAWSEWEMIPGGRPLEVVITVYSPTAFHNSDLDNTIKAILDAANKIVYQDDRWIDRINASRWVNPGGDYEVVLSVGEL